MRNSVLIFVLCVTAATGFPLKEIGKNAPALKRGVRQNNVAQPKHQIKLPDFYTEDFDNEVLQDENDENGATAEKDEDNDEGDVNRGNDQNDEYIKSTGPENERKGNDEDDQINESVSKSENTESDGNEEDNWREKAIRLTTHKNVGDNNVVKENKKDSEGKSSKDLNKYNEYYGDYHTYRDFIPYNDDEYEDDFNDDYDNDDDRYENNNVEESDENSPNVDGLQNRNGNEIDFDNNLQDNEIGNNINDKYEDNYFSNKPSGNDFSVKTNRINTGFNANVPMGNKSRFGPKFYDVKTWKGNLDDRDVSGSASDESYDKYDKL